MTIPIAALLLGAGIMALAHFLERLSRERAAVVHSLAGGVSLSFVMLDLFVELAEGSRAEQVHAIFRGGPEPVHTVASLLLIGTFATFALAAWIERRSGEAGRAVELVPHVAYGALVGGALVEEAHEGPLPLILFTLAMTLHLGVVEHGLAVRRGDAHALGSRLACAVAIAVGALFWATLEPSTGVFQLVLALVAGATLLQAFRDELPLPRDARLGPMAAGAASFALLQQLRWWL